MGVSSLFEIALLEQRWKQIFSNIYCALKVPFIAISRQWLCLPPTWKRWKQRKHRHTLLMAIGYRGLGFGPGCSASAALTQVSSFWHWDSFGLVLSMRSQKTGATHGVLLRTVKPEKKLFPIRATQPSVSVLHHFSVVFVYKASYCLATKPSNASIRAPFILLGLFANNSSRKSFEINHVLFQSNWCQHNGEYNILFKNKHKHILGGQCKVPPFTLKSKPKLFICNFQWFINYQLK